MEICYRFDAQQAIRGGIAPVQILKGGAIIVTITDAKLLDCETTIELHHDNNPSRATNNDDDNTPSSTWTPRRLEVSLIGNLLLIDCTVDSLTLLAHTRKHSNNLCIPLKSINCGFAT
jgi:hypothetical protein